MLDKCHLRGSTLEFFGDSNIDPDVLFGETEGIIGRSTMVLEELWRLDSEICSIPDWLPVFRNSFALDH